MGPELASQLLRAGCNDMGGSLMNESITKAAGAAQALLARPRQVLQAVLLHPWQVLRCPRGCHAELDAAASNMKMQTPCPPARQALG